MLACFEQHSFVRMITSIAYAADE